MNAPDWVNSLHAAPASSLNSAHRLGLLLIAVLILAGCGVREIRPEGAWLQERETWFDLHQNWSVKGRLGLSDGQRGGSLSFDWQARGEQHIVMLRTVAGGRQWRLEFDPSSAMLEGTDIGRLVGPEPDALVEQAVGWPIPVLWMSRWLRGLPAPERARMSFDEDGTLAQLRHQRWVIDFNRWSLDDDQLLLPARIEARNEPYRVRAALSGWHFASSP
ncbi:MAG: lipoprotein insertase outer membrane protein LolB [Pseudomonadota bacterium]